MKPSCLLRAREALCRWFRGLGAGPGCATGSPGAGVGDAAGSKAGPRAAGDRRSGGEGEPAGPPPAARDARRCAEPSAAGQQRGWGLFPKQRYSTHSQHWYSPGFFLAFFVLMPIVLSFGIAGHALLECPALVSLREKYHQLFCVHNSMRQFLWQNNMLLLVRYVMKCLDSFAATQ